MTERELNQLLNTVELPKHTNPLPPFIQTKADNKIEPYKNVNVIIIPENATNGDMIKAVFNCMVIEISKGKVYVEGIYFPFDEEWWNAPYKAESEDNK